MSVTAPEGFVAAGIHAGIKSSRRDMALLATDDGRPVPTAAVFTTTNKFRAAPVEACIDRLAASHIASASARPFAPVPALALPELTTTPAAIPADAASRSMQASTGGARNLLVVNTAAVATGRPSSVASSAISRRSGLIPAACPAATNPKGAVTLIY